MAGKAGQAEHSRFFPVDKQQIGPDMAFAKIFPRADKIVIVKSGS